MNAISGHGRHNRAGPPRHARAKLAAPGRSPSDGWEKGGKFARPHSTKNEKPGHGCNPALTSNLCDQARRRQIRDAMATNPKPAKAKLEGSGTTVRKARISPPPKVEE